MLTTSSAARFGPGFSPNYLKLQTEVEMEDELEAEVQRL